MSMKREVLLGSAGTLAAGALAWLLWGHPDLGSYRLLKSVPARVIERVHPNEDR
jgi:hypothetical protein